jgi:hypothetical protein
VLLSGTTVAKGGCTLVLIATTTTARVFTISGGLKHAGKSHITISPTLGGN